MAINRGVIKVKQDDNSFAEFYPHVYSEDAKYRETSVYAAIEALETANKNATDNYNKANGLVQLDGNALIPSTLIPAEFKEVKVVDDITARDALTATTRACGSALPTSSLAHIIILLAINLISSPAWSILAR